MSLFEARKIIEALRSGVPSRMVGRYFSGTRTRISEMIAEGIREAEEGKSNGRIITGKYGEGKTHMLNSVFTMAHNENMVVSVVTISKESPMDKLHVLYGTLMENTYLPGREQPGFMYEFEQRMKDSRAASDLILYASTELQCNKLTYVLRNFIKEEDADELNKLQSDLLGNFMANADIKKRYRALYHETAKFNENFAMTKHVGDYYKFMSYLFRWLGYSGWVILFDEAELIGRLRKKTRLNAYANMNLFLNPHEGMINMFSLFAFTSSYAEEVIDSKHDFENLEEAYPQGNTPAKNTLNSIIKAPQLPPLSRVEVRSVMETIINLYKEAYDWEPPVTVNDIEKNMDTSGFLLRTKLRTCIEILDQLYQYGEYGKITASKLQSSTYEEDVPDLSDL